MAMVTVKNSAPYTDSAPLLNDPQALRQRAREEGYLHFKQLVPREDMLNVRRQVLETAQQQGWLKDGAPLMDGISKPGFFVIESREGDWQKYYQQILKLRDFHALALHPNIIDALEKLFDEAVLPHSRNICRTIFPKATRFTTPPHQDHLHIGGTEETWTVWMPLGDCPLELGGLPSRPARTPAA